VIATALVLIAVFVPVAFFPGTTGRLYSQFSITIAFSVALSAFNALTLTPALSALLLDRAHQGKGRFFSAVERVIGAGTHGYIRALQQAMRLRWAVVLLFLVSLGATVWLYRTVPRAFVPEEDAGYFITVVQAPAGGSLEYTSAIARQAEQILIKDPDVEGVFSVMGFSFSGAAPNQGLIFTSLKPFAQREGREHELKTVLGRVGGPLAGITGAIVVPFPPPSIPGLGQFGGFEFQVLDQAGTDINALSAATFSLVGAGNASPGLAGLFSSFTANDPQLTVEIDRERALALGVPLSEITSALQIYVGSQYVNDFDFNNRAYRVYVQADKAFRAEPAALGKLYVRSRTGQMLPLANVVRTRETTAPQVITHFNLFRSATINGSAKPGFSSGQALEEMERVARGTLPAGMGFAWSGLSFEEAKSGQQSFLIFGLGLLLVYLTLAAQYESLVLPFIVLLGVPLAVLGALAAVSLRGFANDVYAQVGLLVLVGLAAKNAILIVEFAEQLRARGAGVIEAAIEASRLRLRPILMTSLAFILGVLPLVFASGAGREARNSVGTAVSGGMLVSTVLNLFFIPVLYVVIQTLRGSGSKVTEAEAPAGANPAVP
jgi:HAE1 family hydrophobic/amphiphilic exporter-1